MKRISISIIIGLTLAATATIVAAGRNSAGTYSNTATPFISNTVISSTAMNNQFSDYATALTDSLSRNGFGGMLAPLRVQDGSVTFPSFSFTNETGTGLYRIGANDVGFAVGGATKHEWTSTGQSITGTLGVSGATTLSSTLGVTGATTLNSTLGVTGTSTLAAITQSGNAAYTGANPSSSTGFSNTITPKNIVKAWAHLTLGAAGAVTVDDGFNVASASYSSINLTVNFATALANNNYAVEFNLAGGILGIPAVTSQSTGSCILQAIYQASLSPTFGAQNWVSGTFVDVIVVGSQ